MSGQPRNEFSLEFRPRDCLPAAMQISQAWLPVQVLGNVLVEVEGSQQITLLERFAVEALLTLKSVSPADLATVALIPPELGRWLLNSLAQKRLASKEGETFVSVPGNCRQALMADSLPVVSEKRLDCLWFPLTNEVVVRENSRPLLDVLRSVRPSGSYPLNGSFAGKQRTEVLRRALSEERVYGDVQGRICDLRADGTIGDTVAAYLAAADIAIDPVGSWRIALIGEKRSKRRDGREAVTVEVPVSFPYLAVLESVWQSKYELARDAALTWLRDTFHIRTSTANGGRPVVRASAGFVKRAAEHELIGDAMLVHVQLDREFACTIPMLVEADDPDAGTLLHVDNTIRSYRVASPLNGGIQMSEIAPMLDRLWHLRMFKTLYDLRATGDFAT